MRRGDIGRAERLVEQVAGVVATATGAHGWLWRLRLLAARAEIRVARDEWQTAEQLASEVVERAGQRGRGTSQASGLLTRARARQARGETRQALDDLRLALKVARGTGDPALFCTSLARSWPWTAITR